MPWIFNWIYMPFMNRLKDKVKKILLRLRKQYHRTLFGQGAVLLYHRVGSPESDPQLLYVSARHFDEQIGWLKKNYHILSLEEWAELKKQNKRFPKNSILISFDDGYADNLLEALPILEKHQVPAVFYICTGNIGSTREFWWDAVERILLMSELQQTTIALKLDAHSFQFNEQNRETVYQQVLPLLRAKNATDRDQMIETWAELLQAPPARHSHRSMTWDEVRSMDQSPYALIGAHTHGHPSLGALSRKEQRAEIQQSKDLLEQELGHEVRHFSFPFGTKRDYNQDTLEICRELKFETVAANFPEIIHNRTSLEAFPRMLVRDWELPEFKQQLHQFLET